VTLSSASPAGMLASAHSFDIADPRWLRFLEARADAHPFHHPAWTQLLCDCYGYRSFALALADGAGTVMAGLPIVEVDRWPGGRRWIALPFSDVCPPLLSPNVEPREFAAALADARSRAGASSLEVRAPLEDSASYPYSNAVLHTLELAADSDAVFATFHHSQVRRNVRRAERERLEVRMGQAATDLTRTFYELHVQTRRRLGVPVQPRRFFTELWARMLEPGLGWLALAYSGNRPVAGAVFLAWQRSITYKFGASDPAFWRLRPNHLLFWSAIRRGCEDGYRHFDFGRTDLADHGLRAFKDGWGTREERLVYSTLADRAPQHRDGRWLGLARGILRRSPAWACRAAGEVLYRFAA
jgi:CelD/BcsL family acetyltransferase involved in cellulose biosynthesis